MTKKYPISCLILLNQPTKIMLKKAQRTGKILTWMGMHLNLLGGRSIIREIQRRLKFRDQFLNLKHLGKMGARPC